MCKIYINKLFCLCLFDIFLLLFQEALRDLEMNPPQSFESVSETSKPIEQPAKKELQLISSPAQLTGSISSTEFETDEIKCHDSQLTEIATKKMLETASEDVSKDIITDSAKVLETRVKFQAQSKSDLDASELLEQFSGPESSDLVTENVELIGELLELPAVNKELGLASDDLTKELMPDSLHALESPSETVELLDNREKIDNISTTKTIDSETENLELVKGPAGSAGEKEPDPFSEDLDYEIISVSAQVLDLESQVQLQSKKVIINIDELMEPKEAASPIPFFEQVNSPESLYMETETCKPIAQHTTESTQEKDADALQDLKPKCQLQPKSETVLINVDDLLEAESPDHFPQKMDVANDFDETESFQIASAGTAIHKVSLEKIMIERPEELEIPIDFSEEFITVKQLELKLKVSVLQARNLIKKDIFFK